MNIVTVGRRFQVVIPKEIRERLGLRPGDKLEVRIDAGQIVMYILPRSSFYYPQKERTSTRND